MNYLEKEIALLKDAKFQVKTIYIDWISPTDSIFNLKLSKSIKNSLESFSIIFKLNHVEAEEGFDDLIKKVGEILHQLPKSWEIFLSFFQKPQNIFKMFSSVPLRSYWRFSWIRNLSLKGTEFFYLNEKELIKVKAQGLDMKWDFNEGTFIKNDFIIIDLDKAGNSISSFKNFTIEKVSEEELHQIEDLKKLNLKTGDDHQDKSWEGKDTLKHGLFISNKDLNIDFLYPKIYDCDYYQNFNIKNIHYIYWRESIKEKEEEKVRNFLKDKKCQKGHLEIKEKANFKELNSTLRENSKYYSEINFKLTCKMFSEKSDEDIMDFKNILLEAEKFEKIYFNTLPWDDSPRKWSSDLCPTKLSNVFFQKSNKQKAKKILDDFFLCKSTEDYNIFALNHPFNTKLKY